MSGHPVNLAFRFLLEMAGLAAMSYWGWTQHEGVWRVVLGAGLPLVAAVLWGIFRVPGDPGDAPVAVAGIVRLIGELVYFGVGVALLAAADQPLLAMTFAGLVIFHYAISYDRIRWLLSRRG